MTTTAAGSMYPSIVRIYFGGDHRTEYLFLIFMPIEPVSVKKKKWSIGSGRDVKNLSVLKPCLVRDSIEDHVTQTCLLFKQSTSLELDMPRFSCTFSLRICLKPAFPQHSLQGQIHFT